MSRAIELANKCGSGCKTPDCKDYDEDCEGVQDKTFCWLYDPQKGMCPYLRMAEELEKQS